jgi:hypothetical protein
MLKALSYFFWYSFSRRLMTRRTSSSGISLKYFWKKASQMEASAVRGTAREAAPSAAPFRTLLLLTILERSMGFFILSLPKPVSY